jgi:hypothetical protein
MVYVNLIDRGVRGGVNVHVDLSGEGNTYHLHDSSPGIRVLTPLTSLPIALHYRMAPIPRG